VLVNLIKLGVRSVKDSGWIYVQKPNRSRELGAKVTRHKKMLIITGFSGDLIVNLPSYLLPLALPDGNHW
jgi:hypothetical protein